MDDEARRLKTAKTILTNRRNYRRARDRALARLANAHREEYLELLEHERMRDVQEGKAWLDIAGRTHYGDGWNGSALAAQPKQTAQASDTGNL
jgi:collagenase-like PrtC family protease